MARLVVTNKRVGVSGRRLVTTAGGAPCCCQGGCCVLHRAGTPRGCAGTACCEWGKEFTIIANGTGQLVHRVVNLVLGTDYNCTTTRTFSFIARFGCAGTDENGVPVLLECLSGQLKQVAGPQACFSPPSQYNFTLTCADAGFRATVDGFGKALWAGAHQGGLLDAGFPQPPNNQQCSMNFQTICTQYNGTQVFGTASRTWAPKCKTATYAHSHSRGLCFPTLPYAGFADSGTASYSASVITTRGCGVCAEDDCERFLSDFLNGRAAADLNGDGFVDGLDYDLFFNLFGHCGESTGGRSGRQAALVRRSGVRMRAAR